METTGAADTLGNNNNNSSTLTSSTDSDSNSVLSVIFKCPQTKLPNDEHNVFTYDVPRPLSAGDYPTASRVYVLIDQGRLMSADLRVMWYLNRLGTVQTVDNDLGPESPDQCRIMSFVSTENDANTNDCENLNFVMDSSTRVYFLTALYNMVYCLDMSPSNCSVDIQRGHVMLDEMVVALRRSIEGFVRPFVIPGSNNLIFEPQVYVTVIVHTPFYTSLAQQVLVQGWLINNNNFNEFIITVTSEMNRLENALAKTKIMIEKSQCFDDDSVFGNVDTIDLCSNQKRKLSNRLHNNTKSMNSSSSKNHYYNGHNIDENILSIANNSPDSGFINTLRYGMLAVRLLPQSSISNLIVITDGMITLADIQVLDSVLNQLRCIGVACSFLHVSSQFHPHASHGHVPYSELMQLISTATCGFYLNSFPETTLNKVVNYYHDKFIMWSFKRDDDFESSNSTASLSCTPTCVRSGEWTVRNSNFYGNRQTQLVSKRQISDQVQAHLDNIVCCRMREGFIIEDIQFKDGGNTTPVLNMSNSNKLQLKFILPWTNHIYIEYDLIMKWPPPVVSKIESTVIQNLSEIQVPSTPTTPSTEEPEPVQPDGSINIYYTVTVKGPYEFLHDITCNRNTKLQLQSQFAPKCQFQLSSCRSSSISVTAATTTITKNTDMLPDRPSTSSKKVVTSKYRQALIARFWSTMRSIVQADMLIKHLETYSPSTGYLCDKKFESQQVQQRDEASSLSPNSINTSTTKIDTTLNTGKTDAKSTTRAINQCLLRSGTPLFYYLPTNSNVSFSFKHSQVKLHELQSGQQSQEYADFWKPVCTLDPDSQWPKWFSTYRIGGGVLILSHDRPFPLWLPITNTVGHYGTLSCKTAATSLFNLLKEWCTFVLIEQNSFVKCLDKSETHTDNVSFCIARVSPRTESCCGVVLHLAFQSCVPAFVHYKIIDDLEKSIQMLDSNTTIKKLTSLDDSQSLINTKKEGIIKKKNRKEYDTQMPLYSKSITPHKYVYFMDKLLEKILIRYERIPSQYTTVIFPDGSQPYPAPAVTTSNIIKPNPKLSIAKKFNTSTEAPTGIKLKTITTTTTLSRYLYHRRWIWSSGCNRFSKCSSSESQKLQLQLARILSVLTQIRLREGFRFAHSSAGIINMVLQVDMIEGSSSCPSTPTSQCVIQYVLFPPNILHKHRLKDHCEMLKKKNNDDERSSTSSIDEIQQFEKRQKQGRNTMTSEPSDSNYCCLQDNIDDDYQLITECWIEPQHGKVVTNQNQNIEYMSGLMYEQLADAIWQVDSDCISSLFTCQHMQRLCSDPDISISNSDTNSDKNQQNKTVIVDAGRIYKLPFAFSVVNLLPKCRHYPPMMFNLFTLSDNSDTDLNNARENKQLNNMLERSFYSCLQTINDRSFEVDQSNSIFDLNHLIAKVNELDIGQCFIKRVDSTRLILTVAPSCAEEKCNTIDNTSDDGLQPCNRSRANTWHYTKRNDSQLCPKPQENSTLYYRTMSVGSESCITDVSWAHLMLDHNLCTSDSKMKSYLNNDENHCQELPTNIYINVYDCRQEDIEHFLMSDNKSFDNTLKDDNKNTVDSSSYSSSTPIADGSDEDENLFISNRKKISFDEPVDPYLVNKYLHNIRVVYDRSFVTTIFNALHLGLNVGYSDIQRSIDRCQHRLIAFDITDYIKVVCGHFKNVNSCTICPADNTTLKSHQNMINSTFSLILDRHMLKPVTNHPQYYFYDFIDTLDNDNDHYDNDDEPHENYYKANRLSFNSSRRQHFTNILMGEDIHSSHFNTTDDQSVFPLFVHLVCTVKTSEITKSQSIQSLPTCILELMSQDEIIDPIRKINSTDLKISLEIYCLMLPNDDYDNDYEDDYERFNKTNSSEQLHFPINSNSTTHSLTKHTEDNGNQFIHFSSSLPPRHAQGLADFIAEVEWCMRDEMAAALLKESIVTPDTLEKVIDHVRNSPLSSVNEHEKIPLNFVVPLPGLSKYNSVALFLQKLNQLDIILDTADHNINRMYTLAKSTNDTFYVVKKDIAISPDSTISTSTNSEDFEINCITVNSINDTEYSKPVLPNFWIILKIQADHPPKEKNSDNSNVVNSLIVNVYFHCRFTELDVQGKLSAVREALRLNVSQVATTVNQTLLLCRLHDTRICDPLLEPIIEDHINSDDDENDNMEIEKPKNYFTFSLGQFKCPVVWSTRFALHPRLKQSMLLLGAQVLHSVLDKFSVRNRRNMFVYKESESDSVFYLRLYENSSQHHYYKNCMADPLIQYDSDEDSISRCSSTTSTTATVSSSLLPSNNSNFSRKYSEDLNNIENKSIQTPGTRSLGGYWGDIDSRDVEDLTLKVHGITPVGTEIRVDLVEVLQNRLNDAVLEVLTVMLYRNPRCRLYPDDVHYLQPYGGIPDYSAQLSLPIETKITKFFVHNLIRNAATLSMYPPKYASRHHTFNYTYNTLDSSKPIIRSYLMYNQPCINQPSSGANSGTSGMRTFIGKRGLACILYDIYSHEDNSVDNLYDYPTDPELFERCIQVTCIKNNLKCITDNSGYIKLFVWRHGRVNMEALQMKMTAIIINSLWDIYIERFLWEQPIIIEEPSKIYVNPLCVQYLAKWIAFGAQLQVPLARHFQIQCRIHIDHVLREFRTHLSWFGTLSSSGLISLSIRYFYVPRSQYGQSTANCKSNNIISCSPDPLQLKQKQDDSLLNNLMFYEWKITDTNSIVCPPSTACVLIIVSVTSVKKTKQRRKQRQYLNRNNAISDSDTDNSIIVLDDEENINNEEGTSKTLINNEQTMPLNNSSNDSARQNTMADIKKDQKKNMKNGDTISKLLLLAVSGQSVHTLSYNCHNNDDHPIAIHRLSRWLELRRTAFILSIYHMMGLKNAQKYSQHGSTLFNSHSSRIKNHPDLLLDYKSYATLVGENESRPKTTIDKPNRLSTSKKSIDNDANKKKNKSIHYKKDTQDLYIEEMVKNSKQQRRIEVHKKILYDMWNQVDGNIPKDALRVFYNHSRLLHYCLTPLLFLPQWRFESAATRDHLVDAVKTRNSSCPLIPQWHKRLCVRLTSAYAHYIESNPLFSDFQQIHINKSRSFNDSLSMDIDYSKPTTRYYKKSIPGATGGLLVIETGICQPFYYVKLCCVEKSRFGNQIEDKTKHSFGLLDQSENIIRNMHLHSFTYDFHVRILSDRLNKLVQIQKSGKRNNYGRNLSMLLEHRNSVINNTNKTGNGSKKNAIAGFLDDFLKYYTLPPLYSSCLVLSGVIKRTQISVTGIQLYEYLLENCSEDCDGMAVIKICDSALVGGDDGAPLFDDNDEDSDFIDTPSYDLSDYILVHHMAGSDIQRRQESEMNSNFCRSEMEGNELSSDCQYEVCGLYDATLVMTLSSVKKLLLDTSNEINLSYYVLLTSNDCISTDKEEIISFKTNFNDQQRHSTPIRPTIRGFEHSNNLLLSTSVPSNSFGNAMISGTPTCWGSLDENNTNNNWGSPHFNKKSKKSDLNNHHQQILKKKNLIKFYEKKAAELVAHTVDTAANRCRIHLLWQKFSIQFDQQKLGPANITIYELEELVNKSGLVKPLSTYDRKLGPMIDELCKGPQWFTSLHKLISGQPSSTRCRIYNNYNSEHQYLIILPKRSGDIEVNAFIIIDNGTIPKERIVTSTASFINIVFRRNVIDSDEVNMLVETVGKSICYHIWRTVVTAPATFKTTR